MSNPSLLLFPYTGFNPESEGGDSGPQGRGCSPGAAPCGLCSGEAGKPLLKPPRAGAGRSGGVQRAEPRGAGSAREQEKRTHLPATMYPSAIFPDRTNCPGRRGGAAPRAPTEPPAPSASAKHRPRAAPAGRGRGSPAASAPCGRPGPGPAEARMVRPGAWHRVTRAMGRRGGAAPPLLLLQPGGSRAAPG